MLSIALQESNDNNQERLTHLSKKAKDFLNYLDKNNFLVFAPIDLASKLRVTNRTIINWCSELVNNGYLRPVIVNKRIRHYEVIK